jgi:type 1 glutamine amidotransferase
MLAAVEAPPLRSRAELQAVLAKAPPLSAPHALRPLHVVLIADQKDHGPGQHDYPLWQKRWKVLLGGQPAHETPERQVNLYGPPPAGESNEATAGAPGLRVTTAWQWPSPEQLQSADLLVMFCYRSGGGPRAWSEQRIRDLETHLARGGGLVVIHAATYSLGDLKRPEAKRVVDLTGLVFDQSILVRHGPMMLQIAAAQHPICRGLPPAIQFVDEPYWPPVGDLSAVDVLATSLEAVAKDSQQRKPQPMFWTYCRGKGRVFGCVLGHFNWTFDDPYFRLLLLRGMAWAAGQSPYRLDGLVLRGVALAR